MLVQIVQRYQFYGIPFTFINSFYNYYQLLDVFFVVMCAEILYMSKRCHFSVQGPHIMRRLWKQTFSSTLFYNKSLIFSTSISSQWL